jgi:hypothetical protein
VTAVLPEIGPAPDAGFEIVLPAERGDSGRVHRIAVVASTPDGRWRRFGPVEVHTR